MAATIDFPPFRLDLRAGQLYREGAPVHLRPKTFAVLQHLAERPGALVSKQALLDAVWGNVAVSEDVARQSVGELREAFEDEREKPRFIETVPGRGYRFVANLGAAALAGSLDVTDSAADRSAPPPSPFVGRSAERAAIAAWTDAATDGRRQVAFITGEAGIGKTTLVDTALGDLRRTAAARVRFGRGQCIEYYGSGESYMPVVEALATLHRGPDAAAVETTLRMHAPGWMLRALGVLGPADRAEADPGTLEQTLHRLAACLEALAQDAPLVLVLEDVHWSDYSTLDLLAVVARRREPARLLVLCTLRQADAIVREHPVVRVKRELARQGLCHEVLLEGLSSTDVADYLAARFSGADLPEGLIPLLLESSDGNPFFMVALVDHLLAQGILVTDGGVLELRERLATLRAAIPDGLRAVIEPRLERLTHDQLRVLETASAVGPEFAAHAVARTASSASDLGDVEAVEQLFEVLVRRQDILRPAGESTWPDGSASARYAFRHALYQQVIYQRLSPSTRRRLHLSIGETLEAGFGERTPQIAGELAAHFARGGDLERAIRHREVAAGEASTRFAYQEARLHLEAALALLGERAETPERLQQELPLLQMLGYTLFATEGYGEEGAARIFARLRDVAERLDIAPTRFQAMNGLLAVHLVRDEMAAARALGEEMLALADRAGTPVAVANTHMMLGATLLNLGEAEAARRHAEQGRSVLGTEVSAPEQNDMGIACSNLSALACAQLGRVSEARAMIRASLDRAAQLGTPFHHTQARTMPAQACAMLRDVTEARQLAEESVRLSAEHGFSFFRVLATLILGWCDVEEGRVASGRSLMQDAFEEYTARGRRLATTFLSALLAGASLAGGDPDSADDVLDGALAFAADTGERFYVPELYRLKGECVVARSAAQPRNAEAIAWFERALADAGECGALLQELRAAACLYRVGGKGARKRLVSVVHRFDPEGDCADLRIARALLARR